MTIAAITTIPSREDSPIHRAAMIGTADDVRAWLDRGASPNAIWFGSSPLHLAAAATNAGVVRLLLERGADPNLLGGAAKLPPLHYAVYGHNWTEPWPMQAYYHRWVLATVDALVAAGADIHARIDVGGNTCSVLDAASHSAALIEALLERGCGVADIAHRRPFVFSDRDRLALLSRPRCLAYAWLHNVACAGAVIEPIPVGLRQSDLDWLSKQVAIALPVSVQLRVLAAISAYQPKPVPLAVRAKGLWWRIAHGSVMSFSRLTGWRRRTLL